MVEPQVDESARTTVYRAEVDGEPLVITLAGDGCTDDMSGQESEISVTIEFGGSTYRGCGQALH